MPRPTARPGMRTPVAMSTAVAVLSAATLLTACQPVRAGDGRTPRGDGPTTSITLVDGARGPAPAVAGAKPGGEVTALVDHAFETLDPQAAYTSDAQLVNQLLHRTLTAYRRTGPGKVELVGDLATDTGRASEGNRVWTFTLRENLKFEDGTPITAADVAYGIARSFGAEGGPPWIQQWLTGNPAPGTVYKGPYDGGAPLPPGVQTPDARTLVLRFPQPRPDLPMIATLGTTSPVPQAKDTRARYGLRSVASGPYRVESYVPETKLVLTRNPHWDAATDPARHAYVERFTFLLGQDAGAATQRLLHEDPADATTISAAMVPTASVQQVLSDQAVLDRATKGATPYVGFLKINTQRVRDLAVRRALNCAFDRLSYVKLLGGTAIAEPATTLQPPVVSGFRTFDAYDCGPSGDPAKARKMLDGKKPKLRYGFRETEFGQKQSAFMAATLGKAGFEVVPVPIPDGAYYATLQRRDNGMDIYMASWGPDWPSGESVLRPLLDGRTIGATGNTNSSYFDDAAVNTELDRISALPFAERGKAWSALEERVMRDHAPLVPVFHDKTLKLNGSRVGGLHLDGMLGGTSLVNAFVN